MAVRATFRTRSAYVRFVALFRLAALLAVYSLYSLYQQDIVQLL